MKSFIHHQRKIFLALFTLFNLACGSIPNGSSSGGSTTGGGGLDSATPTTAQLDTGTILYEENCARCHSSLDISDVQDTTADRIQTAISKNWGGMRSLNDLSDDDIQNITYALSTSQNPDLGGGSGNQGTQTGGDQEDGEDDDNEDNEDD